MTFAWAALSSFPFIIFDFFSFSLTFFFPHIWRDGVLGNSSFVNFLLLFHIIQISEYSPFLRIFRSGRMLRGGRQTKNYSQTWSFGFKFLLESIFEMNVDLHFHYLKIVFLEYLWISGEIRYQNGPIGYWKKVTIWKEASIVHVGAVIHDYQGGGAIWCVLLMKRLPWRMSTIEHR